MSLIAPDLVADVSRLSPGASLLGLLLGVLVWTTGWWKRSFWVALTLTTGFGLYGVSIGRSAGTHPLVAGLLLGLSAGVLAMELGRLLAFVSGGLATALLVQTFVPTFPEPLLAYLAGGLACVLLYKLWSLAVFGFIGTNLILYCGVVALTRSLKVDAAAWATQKAGLLTVLAGVGTVLSMVVQSRLEVHVVTRDERQKAKAMTALSDKERAAVESAKGPPPKPRLWGLLPAKRVA